MQLQLSKRAGAFAERVGIFAANSPTASITCSPFHVEHGLCFRCFFQRAKHSRWDLVLLSHCCKLRRLQPSHLVPTNVWALIEKWNDHSFRHVDWTIHPHYMACRLNTNSYLVSQTRPMELEAVPSRAERNLFVNGQISISQLLLCEAPFFL